MPGPLEQGKQQNEKRGPFPDRALKSTMQIYLKASGCLQRRNNVLELRQSRLGTLLGIIVLGVSDVFFGVLDGLVKLVRLDFGDRNSLFRQNGQTTSRNIGKAAADEIFVPAAVLAYLHRDWGCGF